MEYKLDSLNIKNSDYIFVSRNGREYEIGEVLGISYDLDNKGTYDMVVIYDFDAPDPNSPNNTIVELVGWFFGCDFSTAKIRETEQTIREYVDEYEKKLFVKEEKKMVNYKTITEGIFGDCRGVIYIEMVRRATKVCMDAEKIKNFADDLWKKLYENFNEIFVGLGETDYSFNPNILNDNITHWYRVYEEDGNQYADKIEIIKEKVKTIAKEVCINEAFDIMVNEINENMTDCKFRVKAYQQAYNGLEHFYDAVFTIIDEEDSVLNTEEEIGKYIYKYVFLYRDEAFTINRFSINRKEN